MSLRSWGNYPIMENKVYPLQDVKTAREQVKELSEFIPYGNGRSYGDSALGKNIIHTKKYSYMLAFNEETGVLHCTSGVTLAEIIEVFAPRGWFPAVTPGTKYLTVGGAIAADVHGKNHHSAGTFTEFVESFNLLLPDGKEVECSRKKNKELFYATAGGMGLTGIILDAYIKLKEIKSTKINQITYKTKNLEETFAVFEKIQSYPYSVAWIDCLAKGKNLGRSLIMAGDFEEEGKLEYKTPKRKAIPFYFPDFALNTISVKAFNWIYYHRIWKKESKQRVGIDAFFYPLDAIEHWNKMYGKNGFTQYQFILPVENSYQGLKTILEKIAASGMGSFLAVLKLYGKENKNYLSFPMQGYSLALDFKIHKKLFPLLDELDDVVHLSGGRVYLAKDVRLSKENFAKGYPNLEKFIEIRKKYGMNKKMQSLQSMRLEI